MRLSRRALVLGVGAAAAAATSTMRHSLAGSDTNERRLTARSATVNLTGDGYPDTSVWAYDGTVPGPEPPARAWLRMCIQANTPSQQAPQKATRHHTGEEATAGSGLGRLLRPC